MTQRRAHGAWVLALALLSRLAVVVWGWSRFPPEADGKFYHTVAQRIAHGQGYTWLWGDGAVTYAAHYPVGYPALVGAGYAVFGPSPGVAMSIAAVLGALASLLGYDLLARHTTPRRALAGGVLLALHPALVPYTAALMTDGLAASLLLVAAWLVDRVAASPARFPLKALVPLGLLFGALTLLRPQSLVLAPVFGALALRGRGAKGYLAGAAVVVALTVATCLPWTLRNCARMDRCALVSVNGGWNLLIGAQTENGAWQEIRVPETCRNVFSEAGKDTCFEKAAKEEIRARPMTWLLRVPAKLGATFDYFGAGPWYLHASSPAAFGDGAKTALGAIETLVHRITLLGALAVLGLTKGAQRWRRPRTVLAALGALAALFPHGGALAHLALAILAGIDTRLPSRLASAVLAATLALHAVFFGAGRYGLVVVPFVVMVALLRPAPEETGAGGIVVA